MSQHRFATSRIFLAMTLVAIISAISFGIGAYGKNSVVLAEEKKAVGTQKHEEHDGHDDDHAAKDEKTEDAHGDEHAHGDNDHGEQEDHGEKDEHGHGDHDEEEEGGSRFGPGKAITEANKKDGIKLSETAIKTLGLGFHFASGGNETFKLPAKSAVYFQGEVGVYRYRNGWFKLIEGVLVSKNAAEVVIKTSELTSGDQIVKDGVPLLRVAELEAWGGSGDGHGH